ncbi:hypothetical protein GGS23DRAFT_357439 [Durotheca rogersii]|uniref:uncharacterized protein n=1 Tax=Durotheca rogersii TaxID=419775 RepID=UPI00221F7501|nr:uncharacterized protein GGS23DRAFT_357439 [Durotheca rogersii]KAI5865861.1 hypothetical protein GGS23DRAFT_357439 [Durotheca rogersii]
MSRRGINRNGVQGVQVYVRRQGDTDYEQIQPQTDLFPLVGNITTVLDRAFLLLESERGWDGLETIARGIVVGRREAEDNCLFPDPQFPSLGDAIRHFLQAMKGVFPDIYLTYLEGEALTARYPVEPPFRSLLEFDTLRAGELRIQYQYIYNMAQTRNNDWFNTWVFRMALSIAHELTHFFTGYLTGDGRPITPPGVSVRGWPTGEAGRAWELETFGGIVEFWSEGRDPSQPGEPIIFADFRSTTPGLPVSRSYVEAFAGGVVRLPITPSRRARPITRQQLQAAGRREMNILRGSRGTGEAPGVSVSRAGRGGSSGSGATTSSTTRNRAPPPQPLTGYYYPPADSEDGRDPYYR